MIWILFVMFWIRNANVSVHMVHSCTFVVKINLKARHSTVSTVVRQKTRVLSMQDIIILAKDGAGLKSLLRILLMKESSTHYMKQITVNVFISLIIMLWTIKSSIWNSRMGQLQRSVCVALRENRPVLYKLWGPREKYVEKWMIIKFPFMTFLPSRRPLLNLTIRLEDMVVETEGL